jgi:hypothetical protein
MKAISMMALAVAAFLSAACGANDCEEAVERLSECTGITTKSVDVDQCDGHTQCIAKCTKDATCAEINSTDPASNYNQCIAGC